ncbi:acetyl-CoA carboxylase biotin carboxyl carrier protein subunit [Agrobacterium vitis]|uniref:acetyl-CoA carboxylase biotin carboxyl carrier protein subunit n=1 Tax=Allorhizobium ampelinum TaxID=3025782 RepID=UPI001F17BAF9|nr:acetyl-CoA carboxylase biotin carboxyl carrier protein subunit [Allorhizobium ampelinum]MCF1464329.1 acetyl-CoA carboxylase biotin carboxyl carrier protein subunit [Allorhizobium ampelinum]
MTPRTRSKSRSAVDFTSPEVIVTLTAWLEQAGVSTIAIERDDQQIKIVMAGGSAKVSSQERDKPTAAAVTVKAPSVGHFLADHPARADEASKDGSVVKAGDTLGFVKIGPLLLNVTAPQDGILGEALVKSGDLVGYGDPLFLVEQH